MAIKIKFDLVGNPEPPTIILANRNGNKLGQLKVNTDSIELVDKFNDASEISFTINKYIDEELTPLWDKVVDFKLIWCKEWDAWFETKVELDEETETVKTVFCTQLGQAELSQIMLYNIEINTEKDIERDDYKISILYDVDHPEASILNRILMDKAPHYSIAYVSPTIARIQRSFSFDGTSILDAFQEIAEEIGCVFQYSARIENDRLQRKISVYDLQQSCNDCGHRGEFTDKCPKCNSTNITNGYGEDTLIFVTSDELASEGIQLVTDTDSVKNCFKLEAGDDLMTATIRSCNPNGTDYIWYFSDAVKEDMSKDLVDKLNSYDNLYKDYYHNHESKLDTNLVNNYNALVEKYKGYYNTPSTCLNCDYKGVFENTCPNCGSETILSGKNLQSIPTTIKGYSSLMNAYYNTVDLALYLESALMPTVEMSDTNAKEQANLLVDNVLSPVAVKTKETEAISLSTANSAVLSMAKVIVRSTYKVEIKTSSLSDDKIWTGSFVITNYSDENDTAESQTIKVVVNNDTETYVRQLIEKALNKDDTDDYSISGLFEKDYNDFCTELKKYALNPLKSFYDSCDTCLNILIDNGAGNKDGKPDLYERLYEPYYNKSSAISAEIKLREDEIAVIEGVWDETDEENPELITKGLQQCIEKCRNEIQSALNFEQYLGEELWLDFCSYRREDTYSNDNYISDGLNNAELFKKAQEFYDVAENEIYKSAELQHSISTTLNNLLAIDKFKPLVDSFENGNWIRVQVDGQIYKLRLLEYDINFGSFENIPVEFSDVTKIKNGITDVESILSQASSMATSYDSIKRQSNKGDKAQGTIDKWLTSGLNSALVRIQNNDDEEVSLSENGLLCRSYDDITETYSPEQFRLTHNIMAYTTDNWETVSSALGKHEYTKWQDNQWVKDVDYGLSSKFVTAGYVTGSQIIGGEIVSSNYKSGESGTYFDLINGDFEIAGGNIVYDTNDKALTLRNVTIEWSNSNAPEVTVNDITGIDDYLDQLDQLDGRIQTYNQTSDPSLSWTETEKADHIGDLWINPDDGLTKSWNGSSWDAIADSELTELAKSKAQIFTSTPTPPYYKGDLWVQGSSGDILHCVNKRESGSYVETDWQKSSKYTDDTKADEAYALADSAKGVADNAKSIGDKLVNGLGFQETEITGKYVISPVIAGGTLLIGDTSGTYAQITDEGKLICTGADISGKVTATDGEFTGAIKGGTISIGNGFSVSNTGILTATGADISGVIHATDGEFTGTVSGSTIEGGSLFIGNKNNTYAEITDDGILNCSGANITGVLSAALEEVYVPPTYTDAIKVAQADIGLVALTEEEKEYFDIDNNGVCDSYDARLISQIAEGLIEYSEQAGSKNDGTAQIKIDPSNVNKLIAMTASNSCKSIETYLGVGGLKTPTIHAERVLINGEPVDSTTVLYKNDSGSGGSIALSDDIRNYDRICIVYESSVVVGNNTVKSAGSLIVSNGGKGSVDFNISTTNISAKDETLNTKNEVIFTSANCSINNSALTIGDTLSIKRVADDGWYWATNNNISGETKCLRVLGFNRNAREELA